jgi:hypothetical protein
MTFEMSQKQEQEQEQEDPNLRSSESSHNILEINHGTFVNQTLQQTVKSPRFFFRTDEDMKPMKEWITVVSLSTKIIWFGVVNLNNVNQCYIKALKEGDDDCKDAKTFDVIWRKVAAFLLSPVKAVVHSQDKAYHLMKNEMFLCLLHCHSQRYILKRALSSAQGVHILTQYHIDQDRQQAHAKLPRCPKYLY